MMLILLGIPYGSGAADSFAGELAQFLSERALTASQELARERGEFPNWFRTVYAALGLCLHNATIAGNRSGLRAFRSLRPARVQGLSRVLLIQPKTARSTAPEADVDSSD